ncbi:MAG: hypothetical protein PVI86_00310 [Phycisphaerae bacterium]|jgi:hypothetical protein
MHGSRLSAYILLETVIATGLLVVGLAIIGAQVQDAQTTVRTMERQLRARMLAEHQLAELETGLIELESVDDIEEQDFGPRYPDWGWRLITEETGLEKMYLMRLDILYLPREDEYKQDDFDYDYAETLYTLYVMRAAIEPMNFAEDFGMTDDELLDVSERAAEYGCEIDLEQFRQDFLRDGFENIEDLLPCLDALPKGVFDLDAITQHLPPDARQRIQDLLDEYSQQEDDSGPDNGEGD